MRYNYLNINWTKILVKTWFVEKIKKARNTKYISKIKINIHLMNKFVNNKAYIFFL